MTSAQIPSGALPTIFGSDFDAEEYTKRVETLNENSVKVSTPHREKSGNLAGGIPVE